MNIGKTLFAQVMEFIPWTSFARIVYRYGGDSRVRNLACTYILIAIVKKELQIDAPLYSLLQILSVSVFEKTQLSQAFANSRLLQDQTNFANQLNLFDF